MTYSWDTNPVFCFTSDIDWASDEIIQYSHEVLRGDDLKITYFNTHPSAYLSSLERSGKAKILIHPNFMQGSSQGDSYEEVIEYCLDLVPRADGFRSHRYFEVNDITDELAKRGMKFFSNLCTRCEPNLKPLRHRSGMVSLPIFLEDGGYLLMDPSLDFEALRHRLDTPGLKIINFHPAHMAFNTPDFAYTRTIKDRLSREEWNSLSAKDLRTLENKNTGIRSVIQYIIEFVSRRECPVASMHEIYQEYCDGRCSRPGSSATQN